MNDDNVRPGSLQEMSPAERQALLERLLANGTAPKLVHLRQRLPDLPPEQRDRLLERLLRLGTGRRRRTVSRIELGESSRTRKLLAGLARLTDDEVHSRLEAFLARERAPRLQALRDQLGGLSAAQRRVLFERLLRLKAERTFEGPLTFGQERTWIMEQMRPGTGALNIAAGVRASGPLDLEILERSMNGIIQRHDALRTSFKTSAGQPVQVIHPRRSIGIEEIDLRGAPAAEREAAAEERALKLAREPFDLERNTLVRLYSLRIADEERWLLLVMHHIASDEWSMGVLIHEVGELYRAQIMGDEPRLPQLTIQYPDYARWQRRYLSGEAFDQQLSYWRRQLAGAPQALDLPTDRPRPATQTMNGAVEVTSYPAAVSNAFRRLSQAQDATLFMSLLAAFDMLLYLDTGREDMVVGTDFANRNRPETEHLIGFFVNQLVLRTDLSGDPTFRQILARVRTMTLAAYDHQDLPFQHVAEAVLSQRDASRSPLFQVVFDLHNVPMSPLEFEGVTLAPLRLGQRPSKFDLTLFVNDSDEQLLATLEYNTDLFDRATAVRYLRRYQVVLEAVAADPEIRLSELARHSALESAEAAA